MIVRIVMKNIVELEYIELISVWLIISTPIDIKSNSFLKRLINCLY